MINALKMLEKANYEYLALETYGIKKDLFFYLAKRCGFEVLTKKKDKRTFYRLKKVGIPCEKLYSRDEKSTINYLDIADLHIGNPNCETYKIRQVLDKAVDAGVDYVFIAGDIFEGAYDIAPAHVKDEFEHQLEIAYSIFREYPLDIRAIPGNHDFSFDLTGVKNPLKKLEEVLDNEKCNFKSYEGYIQDFEIAGVVKRMMHLENFYFHENVVATVERLHEFDSHGGLFVECSDGQLKPIRFLQCGHIHRTVELYEAKYRVYISQSGSFVNGENFYTPAIWVKGEVLPDLRILRD